MELRHLRYFVAVAEELHFGRAAARLGLAQPPLSQQIRRLEEELGVTLFDRTPRRVRLTDAGRVFLDEARATLAQAERAMRAARRAGRGEIGRLALGFVQSTPMHDEFAAALRGFRARFPEVELVLEQMTTAEQVGALRDGRIAAGFLRPPIDDAGGTLALLPVVQEPFVIVLPAGHALAASSRENGAGVPLRALAHEPFVLFPRARGPGLYDAIVALCRRGGFTPDVRHEVGPLQAVAGLVAAGFGVSVLPASIRKFRPAGVVFRELPAPRPRVEIAMAWRRDEASPALRAFVQAVREVVVVGGSPPRGRVVRPSTSRASPRGVAPRT